MKAKLTITLACGLFLAGLFTTQQVQGQINTGANAITGSEASVAAGDSNENRSDYSIIGGGENNYIDSSSVANFIGSGLYNVIVGDTSVIGGGQNNAISNATTSVIGGGTYNVIINCDDFGSTIAGGRLNKILSADSSTIGGGLGNVIGPGEDAYYSTIAGGYINSASGKYSTIGGGLINAVTSDFSTIAGGHAGKTTLYGQSAHANGFFTLNGQGEAQASEYVLLKTTIATNVTELLLNGDYTFLSGTDRRLVMQTNSTWVFDLMVVVRSANGNSGGFRTNGVVKNVNGVISLNGISGNTIPVPTLYSDVAGWSVTVSADNTFKSLAIKVNGDTTTNRWVATLHTTEVMY